MTRRRTLAIDFGMRRFGVAVSDPSGAVALGLPTIERKNVAADLAAIGKLIGEYDAEEVVVGLPLGQSGAESAMSLRVRGFAAKLAAHTGCTLRFWDERHSTAEAGRMLRSAAIGRVKRQRAVDRVAATLILQNYLDWRAHEQSAAATSENTP